MQNLKNSVKKVNNNNNNKNNNKYNDDNNPSIRNNMKKFKDIIIKELPEQVNPADLLHYYIDIIKFDPENRFKIYPAENLDILFNKNKKKKFGLREEKP